MQCVAGTPSLLIDAREKVQSRPNHNLAVDLSAPIYAIYTSGSTGVPKAVVIPHLGISNRFRWMSAYFGVAAAGAALQTTAHHYDSAVWQLLWPLTEGGATVIPPADRALTAQLVTDLIDTHRVTICDFVASVLSALIDDLTANPSISEQLGSLRTIIIGGEQVSAEPVFQLMARLPGPNSSTSMGPPKPALAVSATGLQALRLPTFP